MLKYPLVFVFNILEDQFSAFGTRLFDHFRLIFEQEGQKCILFPVRNSKYTHIERRAEQIDKKLRSVGPAHVIGLSVSGVDCRIAAAYLSTPMKSLFTVSSPHHGSFFADCASTTEKKFEFIDPVLKLLGLPYFGLAELQTEKMKNLNRIYPNDKVQIFCSSSWRLNKDTSELLLKTSRMMYGNDEESIYKWNDGIFYMSEMKWKNHLLSFDGDHSHVFGADLKVNCAPIYRLALDNAIRCEKKEEGKVAVFF
jgi:hypothetical protein